MAVPTLPAIPSTHKVGARGHISRPSLPCLAHTIFAQPSVRADAVARENVPSSRRILDQKGPYPGLYALMCPACERARIPRTAAIRRHYSDRRHERHVTLIWRAIAVCLCRPDPALTNEQESPARAGTSSRPRPSPIGSCSGLAAIPAAAPQVEHKVLAPHIMHANVSGNHQRTVLSAMAVPRKCALPGI
jgi:hypothetical protein